MASLYNTSQYFWIQGKFDWALILATPEIDERLAKFSWDQSSESVLSVVARTVLYRRMN